MTDQMPDREIRQLPTWARRYADNRALPQLVLMLALGIVFLSIFWSIPMAVQAHRAGQTLRFAVWLGLGIVSSAANVFFSIYLSIPSRAKWADQTLRAWLYRAEGRVTPEVKPADSSPARFVVPLLFGACVLAQVVFGGQIPDRYLQPVSALYVIPFMLYIVFSGNAAGVLAMVLWPTLYTLHAILLLAGAPIVFSGDRAFLNLLIPLAGYGALSFLAAHLYSRIALRRLRHRV